MKSRFFMDTEINVVLEETDEGVFIINWFDRCDTHLLFGFEKLDKSLRSGRLIEIFENNRKIKEDEL